MKVSGTEISGDTREFSGAEIVVKCLQEEGVEYLFGYPGGAVLFIYDEIFKQARFAVRNDDSALDIVQDSMLRLAESYGDRPPEELPLLFQRILQNAIRDHFRRSKVRSLWTTLVSALTAGREDADEDPLDTLLPASSEGAPQGPAELAERGQVLEAIESEIARLPTRQREAFLLRYWEELDVAETASVMGCSEGSVKTHCSRATHALAAALRARGIEL